MPTAMSQTFYIFVAKEIAWTSTSKGAQAVTLSRRRVAVLTNSNEENWLIPQENFPRFKKNDCALSLPKFARVFAPLPRNSKLS